MSNRKKGLRVYNHLTVCLWTLLVTASLKLAGRPVRAETGPVSNACSPAFSSGFLRSGLENKP